MKKILSAFFLTLMMGFPAIATAAALVGEQAPVFTAVDSKGNTVSLADHKGKPVVLEWTNHECPFVKKHYTGNMQALQKKAAEEGAVWLTVISSAPDKQGHVDGAAAEALTTARGAAPAAVLLDASGDIGQLYQAKATPHMFVIDKEGVLVYQGAIDSLPTADIEDIAKADNYVTAALADLGAGRPVAMPSTKAYGCAVKY